MDEVQDDLAASRDHPSVQNAGPGTTRPNPTRPDPGPRAEGAAAMLRDLLSIPRRGPSHHHHHRHHHTTPLQSTNLWTIARGSASDFAIMVELSR
jgi:hypothetical protein